MYVYLAASPSTYQVNPLYPSSDLLHTVLAVCHPVLRQDGTMLGDASGLEGDRDSAEAAQVGHRRVESGVALGVVDGVMVRCSNLYVETRIFITASVASRYISRYLLLAQEKGGQYAQVVRRKPATDCSLFRGASHYMVTYDGHVWVSRAAFCFTYTCRCLLSNIAAFMGVPYFKHLKNVKNHMQPAHTNIHTPTATSTCICIPTNDATLTTQELLNSNTAGFVYVTEVDMDKRRLAVLSPCPGSLPSRFLIAGTIKWQE